MRFSSLVAFLGGGGTFPKPLNPIVNGMIEAVAYDCSNVIGASVDLRLRTL